MKNGDANNNPKLIIAIAVVFILGGAVGSVALLKNPEWWLALTITLFILGIIFLVFGIKRSKLLKSLEVLKADPLAFETTAKFVNAKLSSYASKSSSVNGVPLSFNANVYKKIIYTYHDKNGVEHTAKSHLSYTQNQVDYLKDKRTYKIKCDGALSIIVEEIPDTKSLIEF